ncbi:TetR/AcrR family transcriptional regulator [Bifidobacterium simiarum]|nr:TetR/AcrR family transcriptional regulator [Bifidobacterium simiarum]
MNMSGRDRRRQRTLVAFISSAQRIMEDKGPDRVTIRDVAADAGYNSATLYLYFSDLDQLILYASLKYLSMYNRAVVERLTDCHSDQERLFVTWEVFCEVSDRHPEAFERIFFGAHSQSLTDICEQYYRLFPEERQAPEELALSPIFSSFSLLERNLLVLRPLCSGMDEQRMQVINELMVFGYAGLLHRRIEEKRAGFDGEPLATRFREYLDYLTAELPAE